MIPALYSKIGTIMETVKKIISFQELEKARGFLGQWGKTNI